MTFADMPVAPSPSATAALRPGACGSSANHSGFAAAGVGNGAHDGPTDSRLPDRRLAGDIRRAEAWLAERQIGLIV